MESGDCIKTLEGHTLPVNYVSFSPNNQYILSKEQYDEKRIWNVSTGKCLHVIKKYEPLPSEYQSCLIVGAPWWLSALLAFMRLFISKKISERLKNYSEESCQKYMGGVEYLPNGYFGGTLSYEERYPYIFLPFTTAPELLLENSQRVATRVDAKGEFGRNNAELLQPLHATSIKSTFALLIYIP